MNLRIQSIFFFGLFATAPHVTAQVPNSELQVQRLLTNGSWSEDFTIAGFTGADGFAPVVYDFARRPDGTLLAAGMFKWRGTDRIGPLARRTNEDWESATENWDRQAPDIGFSSLAVSPENVLALSTNSGPFGAVPGEIWIETNNRVRVIGRFRGAVRSMVWFGGRLWVAGFFELNGTAARNLAVWDGQAWSAPPGGAADRAVYSIQMGEDSLVFAGDFTTIGGIAAQHVAEWTGQEWRAYNLGDPIAVSHVYAAGRNTKGELFAAGAITGGLVQWTGNGWQPVGGGLGFTDMHGTVIDFETFEDNLYVTGCITHAGGPQDSPVAVPLESVARWTGSRWEKADDDPSAPIGTVWFDWQVCGGEPNEFTVWDVRFQRLFNAGDELLVGGMFPGIGDTPSQSIIALRGGDWQAVGDTDEGLFGPASELAAGGPGNALYAIGGITHAGQATGGTVFRYENNREWTAVRPRLPEDLQCRHVAVDGAGVVYAGCSTRATPQQPPRPVVLRSRSEGWIQLELPNQTPGAIWDMRSDRSGRIWVAGGVRTGDDTGSGFLVRLDGDQFRLIEAGFNSMVFQIAFPTPNSGAGPDDVLVGGAFTRIGSSDARRVARLIGGRWEPLGAGLSSAVLALASADDAVYVSTEGGQDEEQKDLLLGKWNGSAWIEIATPENGLPAPREKTVYSIRDLLASGRYLIVGGSLYPATGGRNVFVYDGQRFTPLAGGVNAISVDSIAFAQDGLWFGGMIAEAGEGEEAVPSTGIARLAVDNSSN